MPQVIVRHKVGDFDTWIKGHKERADLFSSFSSGFQTFRDTDDPQSVILLLNVTDMEKMQAVLSDPNTEEAKKRHTVIEPIIVSMPVEL
ncbi:MAG: hypothetical protein M3Y85_09035 [Bacteroidota bacterium]|nr:hypothetical protein [Bacteroidota bacterium]